MKVLQLGKFYPIRGGVEKVMWDLTEGLSGRGVDCDMLCAEEGKGIRESVFNSHGRCIRVPSLGKLAATMIAPAMVRWLKIHCREYDIVHIHHPDPMACLALRLSAYEGKVVLHWHSDIVAQKFLLKFYSPLQNWLIRRADIIIATSPVYAAQSPWLEDVSDKIVCVPIGIKDELRSHSTTEKKEGKVVLSVGRFVEYKGMRYVIDAAGCLPDDYEVRIVGDGPLKEKLEEQICRSALSGKVKLLGPLEDRALAAEYNGCDVFVLGSIMKTEAFGIVQLEAMSCGKPVVATRISGSGVAWVNEDGVSGINVTPCEPGEMARAIVSICEDPVKYGRYCAGARRRFEENFTIDAMLGQVLAIYEKLMGNETL